MASSIILTLTLFAVAALALAANNSTEPCHAGKCQWTLQSTHGSGTMSLAGSNSSISDLTPAGGWTIIDCNATSADQDIHVVCHDPSKCDHLHINGAENTVVRLPDDCSSEPFAVVTRVWNHTDESIPASRRSLLERRGTSQPLVQGISLSTDFATTNTSQHGSVTVFVVGSSMPGFDNLAQAVPGCNTTDAAFKRISSTIRSPAHSPTASPPSTAASASTSRAPCPLLSTTSSPTEVSSITLAAGFDAALDGTLSLNADLMGGLTTGDITLFTVGLPGLDFGKIFKIGPTFNIYAKADATFETNLEIDVDLAYTISRAQLVYPPPLSQAIQGEGKGESKSEGGSTFSPGSSDIKLSASPNVTTAAQLSAHVIPVFEFGVTLLGRTAADIYLNLDAYARLDLLLTAGASAAASGSVTVSPVVSPSSADDSTVANSTSTSVDVGASGCMDISTGLVVDAGARGDLVFFMAGDESRVVLFRKMFNLFRTCFGDGDSDMSRRGYRVGGDSRWGGRDLSRAPFGQDERMLPARRSPSQAMVGRGRIVRQSSEELLCPTVLMGPLTPIVSETVDDGT
ncbi:hypothetical protein V8D89_008816 [Ganoderma adspersum]